MATAAEPARPVPPRPQPEPVEIDRGDGAIAEPPPLIPSLRKGGVAVLLKHTHKRIPPGPLPDVVQQYAEGH